MIIILLILASAFGVVGVTATIMTDRKRRKYANRKWEEMQKERRAKSDLDNDLIA